MKTFQKLQIVDEALGIKWTLRFQLYGLPQEAYYIKWCKKKKFHTKSYIDHRIDKMFSSQDINAQDKQ